MVKLVDTRDLKSLDGNVMSVRLRLFAPIKKREVMRKITWELEVEDFRNTPGRRLMQASKTLKRRAAVQAVEDLKIVNQDDKDIQDILLYLVER